MSARLPFAVFLLSGLSLVSAAMAEPAPASASLVEARLTGAEDITGQPGAPVACIDEHNRRCDAGSSYRVAFTIVRPLAGPDIDGVVRRDQISGQPMLGLSYLLVLSPSNSGPQIAWAGFSRYGLCMDDADARRLGVFEQLKRYPCARP